MYASAAVAYPIVKPSVEYVRHFFDRQVIRKYGGFSVRYSVVNDCVYVRPESFCSISNAYIVYNRKRSALHAFNLRPYMFHALVVIRHCSEVIRRLKGVDVKEVPERLRRLYSAFDCVEILNRYPFMEKCARCRRLARARRFAPQIKRPTAYFATAEDIDVLLEYAVDLSFAFAGGRIGER